MTNAFTGWWGGLNAFPLRVLALTVLWYIAAPALWGTESCGSD